MWEGKKSTTTSYRSKEFLELIWTCEELTFAPVRWKDIQYTEYQVELPEESHVSIGLVYLWSQGCSELNITKLPCKPCNHSTHPMYIGCIPEQDLSLFEETGGTLSLNSIKMQNIQCTLKIMRNVKKLDNLTHTKKKSQLMKTKLREHRHDWVNKKIEIEINILSDSMCTIKYSSYKGKHKYDEEETKRYKTDSTGTLWDKMYKIWKLETKIMKQMRYCRKNINELEQITLVIPKM